MSRLAAIAVLASPLLHGIAGCAGLHTSAPEGPVPDGIRVYPPRVLLLVDAEAGKGAGRTSLLVVPDLGAAYDLRPVAVLSRNDFHIDLEDGMLKSLTSDADTTAALALVKAAGEQAGRVAEGVSMRDVEGSYGLPTGVYVLRPDGSLARLPGPAPAR